MERIGRIVWDGPLEDPAPGLPGLAPVSPGDWLRRTPRHAEVMALRDRLLAERRPTVLGTAATAGDLPDRALRRVVDELRGAAGYEVAVDHVRRPDGEVVPLTGDPMAVLARLIEEDVCVLAPGEGAHVLVAACLLFPSTWTLSEKLGYPLPRIHAPVAGYAGDLERRVQRLFDGLRAERPLHRSNWLEYAEPELHQPKPENVARDRHPSLPWLRQERQCMVGLGAGRGGPALFTILTQVCEMPRS